MSTCRRLRLNVNLSKLLFRYVFNMIVSLVGLRAHYNASPWPSAYRLHPYKAFHKSISTYGTNCPTSEQLLTATIITQGIQKGIKYVCQKFSNVQALSPDIN